jgi:hypothetical protein
MHMRAGVTASACDQGYLQRDRVLQKILDILLHILVAIGVGHGYVIAARLQRMRLDSAVLFVAHNEGPRECLYVYMYMHINIHRYTHTNIY